MPYSGNHKGGAPASMKDEKSFEWYLDCICSELFTGANWHLRVGNEMRHIGLRGFGRLHDWNAEHDFKKRLHLEKKIGERLEFSPTINIADIGAAVSFELNNPSEIKGHLEMWKNNEKSFAKDLTEAVRIAARVDVCLYKELSGILEDVQDEVMRIGLLRKRLDLGGYAGHDVGMVSFLLHEHFECDPELGMDFNLG